MASLIEISIVILKNKIFKILLMYFHYFDRYYLFFENGTLHLNKLESHSHKDALCQVWLKLVRWFWRRRFLNFANIFSLCCYYLPLEQGGPLIWTNLNPPLPKDALCQVLSKLAQWFWKRKRKCEKFTITTTTTDDGQIVIRKDHLSLRLR